MVGVKQIIDRGSGQVSSAAALPEASANAFGAGIGDAIERAGSEVQASSIRAMELDRERQRQADLSQQSAAYAQWAGEYRINVEDLKDKAEPDGAGHVDNVRNLGRTSGDQFLGGIQDPKVRAHFAPLVEGVVADQSVDADVYARGLRLKSIGEGQRDATDGWSSQLLLHPEPTGLKAAIEERTSTINALEAPPEIKQKLLKEALDTVEFNYGQGLTRADPTGAKAVFDSGYLSHLTPEHRLQLLNANDTDIRVQTADQNRQVSQAAEQVRVDAAHLTHEITYGELPTDDEVKGVITRATALQAHVPGMQSVVEELQHSYGTIKTRRLTDKWTSADWAHAVNPLAAKVAQGKATDDEQQQLRVLEELRPAAEARFKSDPDGFSSASGIVAPQVDLNAPDPGTVQARKSWAKSFARTGGLVEAPYLSKDQLQQVRDRVAQSPAAAFEVAQELKGTWGMDAAPSIVRQIGGPAKGDMQLMLGLDPAIAQRYQRGREALDKKAVDVNEDVARQVYGTYVRGVPADLQGPMFDAARKIAAGWMLEKGFTKVPANFDDVMRASLQYAAGRTGDVRDGNAPGGMANVNGRYAWLPSDMSTNDLLTRFARAQPQDWVNAATDAHGNSVKSAPHYIGPDGRPKPYTKGDALNFAKGTLQTLDQGLYHLIDRLGHTVVDERGQPWTFDVRRLPRSHFGASR